MEKWSLKKEQYAPGGPYEKWLKTVKTCRTRESCCPAAGYGNILVRDFPTKSFTSSVINKNFIKPSADEAACEKREIEAEKKALQDAEAKAAAEAAAKAKAKAEAEARAKAEGDTSN